MITFAAVKYAYRRSSAAVRAQPRPLKGRGCCYGLSAGLIRVQRFTDFCDRVRWVEERTRSHRFAGFFAVLQIPLARTSSGNTARSFIGSGAMPAIERRSPALAPSLSELPAICRLG